MRYGRDSVVGGCYLRMDKVRFWMNVGSDTEVGGC